MWLDRDNDGVQDAGEPGLVGTGVNLVWYGKDGVAGGGDDVTYTTTTGANGVYNFTMLPAGAFKVDIKSGDAACGRDGDLRPGRDCDSLDAAATTLTDGQNPHRCGLWLHQQQQHRRLCMVR